MNRPWWAPALLLAAWLSPLAPAWGAAGRVVFVEGAVSAQAADGTLRLLGTGAEVAVGDRIRTGSRSHALLEFDDGSKVTVRPGSVFVVERYRHGGDRGEALFALLKGGLRALTGAISKLRPDAFQVRTPVATLGIRGTEFDARLCEDDCAREERQGAGALAGRVALQRGSLEARDVTGRVRPLAEGAAVQPGDTLTTGADAFAVIFFRDGTRVTLQPESSFVVQDYRYDPAEASTSRVFFNLLRGGLRALTGALAKINRPAFQVRTPTATIGVRGTGFDVYHRNPTWTRVWIGRIEFRTAGGTLVVEKDQTVFLPDAGGKPVILPKVPVFFRKLPGPRPDKVGVDPKKLFGGRAVRPGLWVYVRRGRVRLGGPRPVVLTAGQSGYANGRQALRLQVVPVFMLTDPTPLPGATPLSAPLSCEVR